MLEKYSDFLRRYTNSRRWHTFYSIRTRLSQIQCIFFQIFVSVFIGYSTTSQSCRRWSCLILIFKSIIALQIVFGSLRCCSWTFRWYISCSFKNRRNAKSPNRRKKNWNGYPRIARWFRSSRLWKWLLSSNLAMNNKNKSENKKY